MLRDMTTQKPFTLLQLSGASLTPPPLQECALVLIDVQREYLDGMLALPDVEPALKNITRLLAAARDQQVPVLHVAHLGASGTPFDPASGGKIIDSASPIEGEAVITKTLPNAFADTDLRSIVTKLGDPHLVLVGFMTHMCISSTARATADLGLQTTVVIDATATRSLPSPDSDAAIGATELHQATLAALSDRFSLLATTSELIS